MDISPIVLRKETAKTLREVETYLARAAEINTIAPLLLAKAQCLNTLALLNEKPKK